jgi:hypothetical protein
VAGRLNGARLKKIRSEIGPPEGLTQNDFDTAFYSIGERTYQRAEAGKPVSEGTVDAIVRRLQRLFRLQTHHSR